MRIHLAETFFDDIIPQDLREELGRDRIDPEVDRNLLIMYGDGKSLAEIDDYLLNCNLVTQDERELIIEELYPKFEETQP